LLSHLTPRLAKGRTLHEATVETLNEVLAKHPQGDDVTVVTISFHDQASIDQPDGARECVPDEATTGGSGMSV
jgi:hypothetical protein